MGKCNELEKLLHGVTDALIEFEKSCAKTYLKMYRIVLTPELAKAIHPEQTEINNHVKRLGLVKKLLGEKPNQSANILSINPIKLKKEKSLIQDVYIACLILQLQETKLSQYQFLAKLVDTLKIETAGQIIEQCIAENTATSTWVKRTLATELSNFTD